MRPRISNGVRRGLERISAAVWPCCADPAHPWSKLRLIEKRELARALAWLDWHRTHKSDGTEITLPPRKPRGRRRSEALEQIQLPFESQDAGRSV